MLLEEFVDMRVRAGETERAEIERGRRARAAGDAEAERAHRAWERGRRSRASAAAARAARETSPRRELAHASR